MPKSISLNSQSSYEIKIHGQLDNSSLGWFGEEMELAHSQNSRLLELRATLRRARRLQNQGRTEQGRESLAECHARFTEVFGTADLQEARELLDALQSAGAQARAVADSPDGRAGQARLLALTRLARVSQAIGTVHE